MPKKSKYIYLLLILLILFFSLVRFVNLDADRPLPVFATVIDEGYKTQNAKYAVLYNSWFDEDINGGLYLSPLSVITVYLSYKILGVSLHSTRVPSAIFGILSVLFLYLIIERENKKVALLSSFLLSINFLFFILNRTGLNESFTIFLIILSFYVLSKNKNNNITYVLAGSIMGLSFLSKISQVYFMLVPLIFFFLEHLKKNVDFKKIILYFSTYSLFLIGYWIYIYIFIDQFKPVIELIHMEQTASMFLFIARSIILIGNYFFSFPSLFLLIMMTIVYFWKDGFPTLNINGLKNYVKSKGFTEIMSFSWLFGTLFGVIFVAIVDRRLSFIIIPLVIYSSLSIYGNKKTYNDLKMRNNTKVNILEYLMVLLLIVSFIINFILFSNKNIFDSLHGIFKFTGDVPNIASLFQIMIHNPYFYYISGMFLGSLGIAFILFKIQKNHANKRLFWGTISLFLIITLSVSGFIKFNTNMFLLTSSYFSPIDLIIISIIISITITIIITTNNNSLFIRIIKNIYILYCISMIIIFSLISPSFSVLEANQMIKQHTIPGDYVMGFSSFGLTIDSGTKALFYIFNYPVNNTVKGSPYELYHPKIYLRPSPEWGNFTDKPFINEIPYTLEYIGTYNLNPFLSYGKPMMQIEAYEIKYVEKKDTIFNYQNNILNNN